MTEKIAIPAPESPDEGFSALLGAPFAHGSQRDVHDVIGCPDLVIKQFKYAPLPNWTEYFVSEALAGRQEQVASIFAVARSISASGKYLIMERLGPLTGKPTGALYPQWLNDCYKSEVFGANGSEFKILDYGELKLSYFLGSYKPGHDDPMPSRLVSSGEDEEYRQLVGDMIAQNNSRSVHKVQGHPGLVIKVCTDSFRANAAELFICNQLHTVKTVESEYFGRVECSRSGRYLIMERLVDLERPAKGPVPPALSWLPDVTASDYGQTEDGRIKLRSYARFSLGAVLSKGKLMQFK